VGNLKGAERVYQQTFIDTYAKGSLRQALRSQDARSRRPICSMTACCRFSKATTSSCWAYLTDRGCEYCGNPERHEYELYLAIEDIDHSRTKTKSPQTNGICERFHKTYSDARRKLRNAFLRAGCHSGSLKA
jgi:hypothetical protein